MGLGRPVLEANFNDVGQLQLAPGQLQRCGPTSADTRVNFNDVAQPQLAPGQLQRCGPTSADTRANFNDVAQPQLTRAPTSTM